MAQLVSSTTDKVVIKRKMSCYWGSISPRLHQIFNKNGGVAQLVEHSICTADVRSSTLLTSTTRMWRNWQTRQIQNLVLKDVGVRVPPSAHRISSLVGRATGSYPEGRRFNSSLIHQTQQKEHHNVQNPSSKSGEIR